MLYALSDFHYLKMGVLQDTTSPAAILFTMQFLRSTWLIKLTRSMPPVLGAFLFSLYFSVLLGLIAGFFLYLNVEFENNLLSLVLCAVLVVLFIALVSFSLHALKKESHKVFAILTVRTSTPQPFDYGFIEDKTEFTNVFPKTSERIGVALFGGLCIFIILFGALFSMGPWTIFFLMVHYVVLGT